MSLKKLSRKLTLYINILVYLLFSGNASAAAWVQNQGKGQLIVNLSKYRSTYFFDSNGKRINSGNIFEKYEINPFAEYSITNNITIGINPVLQYWNVAGPAGSAAHTGFRECGTSLLVNGTGAGGGMFTSEIFLRRKMFEAGNAVFSMQPLVKIPCLFVTGTGTSVAWNAYDIELRGLAGYSFEWHPQIGNTTLFAGQSHFTGLEVAYRGRGGNSSDQVRIDGTAGLRLNEKILLLGQFFSTTGTKKENTVLAAFNENNLQSGGFSSLKLQVSAVAQRKKNISAQLGLYTEKTGRNAGSGSGVILSMWKNF